MKITITSLRAVADGAEIELTLMLDGGEEKTQSVKGRIATSFYMESGLPTTWIEPIIIDREKCEYLIPDVLFDAIEDKYATCKALKTTATWYGVTYREDMDSVKASIKNLVDTNEYPNHLWDE